MTNQSIDSPTVLVVDDSPFMRTVIGDILERGGVSVVGEACDGVEAIEAVRRHRPDVITMDIEMEGMDGLEAVDRIMADRPTPVLMLSAHTEDGADVTFEALARGAVDFFPKPGGEVSAGMATLEEQLVARVRSVAEAQVRPDRGRFDGFDVSDRADQAGGFPLETESYVDRPTLVIGASTGGPSVVEGILRRLPLEPDLRILIVQHMPDGFTGRFAARLDDLSRYRVREATDGTRIGGGEAVVAKGGVHMIVTHYADGRIRLRLSDDPPVHAVRPAVDPTMCSVAETVADPIVGVVLTGMGEDGAVGVEAIKSAGGHTIVQDESTSTVFGMPKRAIETGAVDHVEPIDRIVERILAVIRENRP